MAHAVNDVVLLFGDSQTQFGSQPGGLVNRLAAHYARVFDVVNRGFSGYTTDQARVLAPRIFEERPREAAASGLPSGRVRLVTVWFGSNDAAVEGHHQHVPRDRFQDNLRAVLDTIEARTGGAKVLLLTPVTLIPSTDRIDNSRRPEVTRSYCDAILAVAEEREPGTVAAVDLYSMFEELGERFIGSMQPLLQEDGLHISPLGYELIFHKVVSMINSRWPELDASKLQATYPLWRDVLPEDKSSGVALEPRSNSHA